MRGGLWRSVPSMLVYSWVNASKVHRSGVYLKSYA